MTSKRNNTIATIAREILGVPTLDSRRSDSLDFHDVSVWSVKEALERAYDVGRRDREPRQIDCPACGRTIDIKTIK